MSELNDLRKEIRADFAILEARQADMSKRLEGLAGTSEQAGGAATKAAEAAMLASEAARRAAEAARRAAEAAQKAALSAQESAQIAATGAREAAEHFRWTQGRMRLMNDRFDRFLDVLEGQQRDVCSDVDDLKQRVRKLEEERPPA